MKKHSFIFAVALSLSGAQLASADAPDPKVARTWKAKCAACHGDDGKGNTEQAKKMGGLADLSSAETQKKLSDDRIKEIITKGTKETRNGKPAEMDAYADLSPAIVDGLVKLIRSLAK